MIKILKKVIFAMIAVFMYILGVISGIISCGIVYARLKEEELEKDRVGDENQTELIKN